MSRRLICGSVIALFALQASCSGGDDPTVAGPDQCPEGNMIGDVCAGVPAGNLCDTDQCVINEFCSEVHRATYVAPQLAAR